MEHKITIKTGLLGNKSKIMLNDFDISDFLKGVTINLEIGAYNSIEMKCVFPTGTKLEYEGLHIEEKIKIQSEPCHMCKRFVKYENKIQKQLKEALKRVSEKEEQFCTTCFYQDTPGEPECVACAQTDFLRPRNVEKKRINWKTRGNNEKKESTKT